MKKIVTTTVGRDFAESNWVLLDQTAKTLLIFKPEIHPGGVRGFLARYKIPTEGIWPKDTDFKRIKPLEPGYKVEIELKTETLEKLKSAIEERSKIVDQGIKQGTREYVVAEKSKVIVVDDESKREIFDKILEKGYSDEFWNSLRESEPDLATHLSISHLHAEKMKTLDKFDKRLNSDNEYAETSGQDSWQKWIYNNNWLFGVNYLQAIEKARISIGGNMPDYLFLTADHFVDVLEIKLPEEDVIVPDPSHPGAFKWCGKTNEAIGQIVSYLDDIQRLQLELEREIYRVYEIAASFVKPRGFILIGKKDGWSDNKKAALRKLNFHLHGIEVLTYSDLMERGKAIVKI